MKTKISSVLVLFCLLMAGCKKADPVIAPSTSPNPVFYFNGTVNGAQVNLQAGVNNYYMFSSYALDGNGVYDFTGELKNYNCTSNCANSLKVYIKDYRQYSLSPTNIDTTLVTGYYSFATPTGASSKFYVQFKDSLYNSTSTSYSWNFGDGTTSTQDNPLHLYAHPGIYNVSLNTQSMYSCSSSLTNNVMVGQVGNPILMAFGGSASGNTVGFSSSIGYGTPPYTLNWDFGDGNTINTGTAPTTSHTYSTSGVYAASLSVTDAANNTQVSYANIATQNTSICHANFYPGTTTPISNQMNLADVTIEWHDANGNLYTSSNNSQSSLSMFKIISISNYQNNSSGQPTKQIHAKVSCTLYNGTASIPFSGDIVFAVAHL